MTTDQRCRSRWRRQRVLDGDEMQQHEVVMVSDLALHAVDPDGESCSTPFSTESSASQISRHITKDGVELEFKN